MMQVVLMLAGAENGSPNWVVIVLGNIFVCCLEGLIVGIQVLRLSITKSSAVSTKEAEENLSHSVLTWRQNKRVPVYIAGHYKG